MMDDDPRIVAAVDAAEELYEAIAPLLAGKGSAVQAALLADLTSSWLWGHQVENDPEATTEHRMQILQAHMAAVLRLVLVKDREGDTRLVKDGCRH